MCMIGNVEPGYPLLFLDCLSHHVKLGLQRVTDTSASAKRVPKYITGMPVTLAPVVFEICSLMWVCLNQCKARVNVTDRSTHAS